MPVSVIVTVKITTTFPYLLGVANDGGHNLALFSQNAQPGFALV